MTETTATKITYVFDDNKSTFTSVKKAMSKMWACLRNKLFAEEEPCKIEVMKVRTIATSIVDPSGLKKEQLGVNWVEQAILVVMTAIIFDLDKYDRSFVEVSKLKEQLTQDIQTVLTEWLSSDNHVVKCLADDLRHRSADCLDQIFAVAREAVNGWDNTTFDAA